MSILEENDLSFILNENTLSKGAPKSINGWLYVTPDQGPC